MSSSETLIEFQKLFAPGSTIFEKEPGSSSSLTATDQAEPTLPWISPVSTTPRTSSGRGQRRVASSSSSSSSKFVGNLKPSTAESPPKSKETRESPHRRKKGGKLDVCDITPNTERAKWLSSCYSKLPYSLDPKPKPVAQAAAIVVPTSPQATPRERQLASAPPGNWTGGGITLKPNSSTLSRRNVPKTAVASPREKWQKNSKNNKKTENKDNLSNNNNSSSSVDKTQSPKRGLEQSEYAPEDILTVIVGNVADDLVKAAVANIAKKTVSKEERAGGGSTNVDITSQQECSPTAEKRHSFVSRMNTFASFGSKSGLFTPELNGSEVYDSASVRTYISADKIRSSDGWLITARGIVDQPEHLGWNSKSKTPPIQYERLILGDVILTDEDGVQVLHAWDKFTNERFVIRKYATEKSQREMLFNEIHFMKPQPDIHCNAQIEEFRGVCVSNEGDFALLVLEAFNQNIGHLREAKQGIPPPFLSFVLREVLHGLMLLHTQGITHNKITENSIFIHDKKKRFVIGNLSGCVQSAEFVANNLNKEEAEAPVRSAASSRLSNTRRKSSVMYETNEFQVLRRNMRYWEAHQEHQDHQDSSHHHQHQQHHPHLPKHVVVTPWSFVGKIFAEMRDPLHYCAVEDMIAIGKLTKKLQCSNSDSCFDPQQSEFIEYCCSGQAKNALEGLAHQFIASYQSITWQTMQQWISFKGTSAEIFAKKLLNKRNCSDDCYNPRYRILRYIGRHRKHEATKDIEDQLQILSEHEQIQYRQLFAMFADKKTGLLDALCLQQLFVACGKDKLDIDTLQYQIIDHNASSFKGFDESSFVRWWSSLDFFQQI